MLDELSKKDKKWRRLALSITKDKDEADEIVQEMYIKIHDLNKEMVNDFYVYYTMKHIFYSRLKKREIPIDIEFEILLSDSRINNNYTVSNDDFDELELILRKEINECLNELDFETREILLHTCERSLRANEKKFDGVITKMQLYYERKKGLEKLKKIYHERNKE